MQLIFRGFFVDHGNRFVWGFWSLTLAISAGIVIAALIIVLVYEARAQYEVRQVLELMEQESRKLQEDLQAEQIKRLREQRIKRERQQAIERLQAEQERQKKQKEADRISLAVAAANRDRLEGRYLPPASPDIDVNDFACKDGLIQRRIETGWALSFNAAGDPVRCRTNP